jgi:CheY-like chemotaxis protein
MQRVTKLPVEEILGVPPDEAEEARLAGLQFPGVPSAAPAGAPVRVLLVEDDEYDAELTRLALSRCTTPNSVDVVRDGAQGVDWIRNAGGPAGVDLVLVDLKMPVMDGFELLERLRAEHDLEKLAVVVLTTSSRLEDRRRAHELGAHAYVTKEASFPHYRDLLEGLLADVTPT